MTVYLIRDPETCCGRGALKIGYTRESTVSCRRMKDLQIACASQLEVVHEICGAGKDVEQALHGRLTALRVRSGGEWFANVPEVEIAVLQAHIAYLKGIRSTLREVTAGAPVRDPHRLQLLSADFASAPDRGHYADPPLTPGDIAALSPEALAGGLSCWLRERLGVVDADTYARAAQVVTEADRDIALGEWAMRQPMTPRLRLMTVALVAERMVRRKPPAEVKSRHLGIAMVA